MAYDSKVIDHFENPRNVGAFGKDENQDTIGTGLVGAPACFSGETLIATADGSRAKTLKELHDDNNVTPVWSFNLDKKTFEIKNAKAIYTGKKVMDKICLSDAGTLFVTADHKFLRRPDFSFIENEKLNNDSIVPFKRAINKRGYWFIRAIKAEEYKSIFLFQNQIKSLADCNIHHLDTNKQNDFISNLKLLSISDHRLAHEDTIHVQMSLPNISKEQIIVALQSSYERAEAANKLDITTDVLYQLLCKYGIGVEKRKNSDELNKLTSERMVNKNPYFNFSGAQKIKFATHKGPDNGRWIDISNEDILKIGNNIFKKYGEITTNIWRQNAKKCGVPMRVEPRFGSWNNFKELVLNYNHTIITREKSIGTFPAYTLQVEENNNYVVLTKLTKNIHEGIVVKNCGDVMKLQIKVEDGIITDAKFRTFGCGSAIASSSLVTEWIKGMSLDAAEEIKNSVIAEELVLPVIKIHCSILAEDAVKAAIADYRNKQEKLKNEK